MTRPSTSCKSFRGGMIACTCLPWAQQMCSGSAWPRARWPARSSAVACRARWRRLRSRAHAPGRSGAAPQQQRVRCVVLCTRVGRPAHVQYADNCSSTPGSFRTAHSLLPRLKTQTENWLFFCKGTKAVRCHSRREILYPGAGAICVMLIEPAGWQLVPLPDYQQIQGHEKCCSHPKRYKAEE